MSRYGDSPSRNGNVVHSGGSGRSGSSPSSSSSGSGGSNRGRGRDNRDNRDNSSRGTAVAVAAERETRHTDRQRSRHRNSEEDTKQETLRLQSDSRDSTRRALARLNEASSIAEHNLNLVNSQSEQFNRMEKKLDEASVSAKNADAKVDHLKSLNKWFFLPSFGAGKAARREQEFRRQQESQNFETKQAKKREDHWTARNDRLAKSDERINDYSKAGPRSFNSTPLGLDRDNVELEIDDNLGQISSGLGRLKMMGLQMGEELKNQDDQLKRIDERAGFTQDKISRLNGKVDQIMDKPRSSRRR